MVPARLATAVSAPKYAVVAERIRAQIADGMLMPGDPAPSGSALSRATGYSSLTCRKALGMLIRDGVLVSGSSRNARPRVPLRAPTAGEQTRAGAARALSAGLAARRRAAGLTQAGFAALVYASVTTVGHAETGRLWQSRAFWERADKALVADGELLDLHDAYRAAVLPAHPATAPEGTPGKAAADAPSAIAAPALESAICVTITWADGTVTAVYPPQAPARPAGATPIYWPRGLPGGRGLVTGLGWLAPSFGVTTPERAYTLA
jgi:DNA-binding transcriptional regulator YhcF (GntR family)